MPPTSPISQNPIGFADLRVTSITATSDDFGADRLHDDDDDDGDAFRELSRERSGEYKETTIAARRGSLIATLRLPLSPALRLPPGPESKAVWNSPSSPTRMSLI